MSKLTKAFALSCGFSRTIHVTNSTTVQLLNEYDDWNLLCGRQGFLLYPNLIALAGSSDLGTYWIEILKSDQLKVDPKANRAIMLPYRVPPLNK